MTRILSSPMLYPLLAWCLAMSITCFTAMGVDKRNAQRKRQRIPELSLFALGLLGGALGGLLGMHVFRHKTRHATFRVGMPLLLMFNLLLVGALAHFLQ